MRKIFEMLSRLATTHPDWSISKNTVTVGPAGTNRSQRITIAVDGADYILRSTVLSGHEVTQSDTHWRDLARAAWRRNAQKTLVTFTFDTDDSLIDLIRHPHAHLDAEELEASILALARECDRFEFVLTGEDEE